jgi:hypothetical protein
VRATAVALAMMRHRDGLFYVMYLCRKMTMYCCEQYGLSLIYMSLN